jgi:hypothetical protein
VKNKNVPSPKNTNFTKGETSKSLKVKEEDSPKAQTYKECLLKGVDPLDSEHIDMKIGEKLEQASKILKEELREEILKELRAEFTTKFEELKKEYEIKYDFNLSDDDHMDIAGHGQQPE